MMTQRRSDPVCYEIIEKSGRVHGPFSGFLDAQAYADTHLANLEQDVDYDFHVEGVDYDDGDHGRRGAR